MWKNKYTFFPESQKCFHADRNSQLKKIAHLTLGLSFISDKWLASSFIYRYIKSDVSNHSVAKYKMSRLAALLVATFFICVIAEEGSFNVTQGNCSTALAKDMVYREHVYKYFIPLVERNATVRIYKCQ